jgi:hypothetical protein
VCGSLSTRSDANNTLDSMSFLRTNHPKKHL